MNTEALNRLSAAQNSLFTTRQAAAAGLSYKQVEHGVRTNRWERLHQGVYRMAGSPPTALQLLHAAVLAGGSKAMASHRGAAWLWGLTEAMQLEVSAPNARLGPGIVTHRLPAGDIRPVLRRRVPSTDPLRTVLDLAGLGNETLLLGALDRGVSSGLFGVDAVAAELGRRAGRGVPGVTLLRECLRNRLDLPGERVSGLESAMDRLLRRHRIPPPHRQYRVAGTRYRLDYAWPAARLAVEVDGYGHHTDRAAFGHDRRRQNDLVLAGWTVLRFTWHDVVHRPSVVAAQIWAALAGALV